MIVLINIRLFWYKKHNIKVLSAYHDPFNISFLVFFYAHVKHLPMLTFLFDVLSEHTDFDPQTVRPGSRYSHVQEVQERLNFLRYLYFASNLPIHSIDCKMQFHPFLFSHCYLAPNTTHSCHEPEYHSVYQNKRFITVARRRRFHKWKVFFTSPFYPAFYHLDFLTTTKHKPNVLCVLHYYNTKRQVICHHWQISCTPRNRLFLAVHLISENSFQHPSCS